MLMPQTSLFTPKLLVTIKGWYGTHLVGIARLFGHSLPFELTPMTVESLIATSLGQPSANTHTVLAELSKGENSGP